MSLSRIFKNACKNSRALNGFQNITKDSKELSTSCTCHGTEGGPVEKTVDPNGKRLPVLC